MTGAAMREAGTPAARGLRQPDFLIIGAMKAGTTTLYRDLLTNPQVFMSSYKEPENLRHDEVLTAAGREAYAALFRGAREGQICGEASTAYSKRPTYEGVAARARTVLGPQASIIYLVREPVARVISHHYHAYSAGLAPPSIDEAVRSDSTYVDYSRYAMQIEPWLAAFGSDRVRVICFEEFIADRAGTVESLSRFMGIPPRSDLVRADKTYNRSEGKPIKQGSVFQSWPQQTWYRRFVRPFLPMSLRQRLLKLLLPKAPPRPEPPTMETVEFVLNHVQEDMQRLARLLGRERPFWDLEAVRRRHAERTARAGAASR
jgi:hypothetical protein